MVEMDVDVIFVFAFGKFDEPAESPNWNLWFSAKQFARFCEAPSVTQRDIVLAGKMPASNGFNLFDGLTVYVLDEYNEPPPSTLQLIKRFLPFILSQRSKVCLLYPTK